MRINRFVQGFAEHWPVKILALAVAVLLFFFNQILSLDETVLQLDLEVQTADHLAVADEHAESVRVRVRGEQSIVQSLSPSDFRAVVRAGEESATGRYNLPVHVERRSSAVDYGPLDFVVEPDTIQVTLDERRSGTVRVVPDVEGFAARGYELVESFVTPAEVEIEGPRRHVEGIETVETETVDLSGRTNSFSTRLALRSPNEFIEFSGGATIEYRAVFRERIETFTMAGVSVDTVNLFPDLNLSGIDELPSLQIEGPLLELEVLTREEVDVTADLGRITEPGTYTVPLEVELPERLSLIQITPEEVTVTVTGSDPETEAGE
ncbi:MAG: YbbR-like domain-containing protein [bacterium]